jgi:hypothetical protein
MFQIGPIQLSLPWLMVLRFHISEQDCTVGLQRAVLTFGRWEEPWGERDPIRRDTRAVLPAACRGPGRPPIRTPAPPLRPLR